MKRTFISLFSLGLALLLVCGLAYPAYAQGSAPVAKDLELKTYRNVSVGGQLEAFDPDGDVVSYQICTQPVKGHIELEEDGSFIYHPNEGKKGRDYFGYKAVDAQGNLSQEATVIIKIQKQRKDISYSDMEGSSGEYAALLLAEEDILVGEQIGGEYCFQPERQVTRGEFISMCMQVSGRPLVTAVMSTGYSDDGQIPDWLKPYAAATVMAGIDSPGMAFDAQEPITQSQALLILNKALGLNDVSYITLDQALDRDMAQACANLSASGISDIQRPSQEALTRIEAADLLSRALELISGRSS